MLPNIPLPWISGIDGYEFVEIFNKFCFNLIDFQDLELENQKLRETLDEYHVEFAEVKNQGTKIFYFKIFLKLLLSILEKFCYNFPVFFVKIFPVFFVKINSFCFLCLNCSCFL